MVIIRVGVGYTVIVNVFVGPGQLAGPFVRVGVTTMVATIVVVPLLTALNEAILPVPAGASPMPGSLFVQEKDVDPIILVVAKVMAVVLRPLQRACTAGWLTCPAGL